jgi:two-component system, NtrC family, sensor kinase
MVVLSCSPSWNLLPKTRSQETVNILIVDDSPDNLRFLSKLLSDRGYTVRRAISGQLALNAVYASPPDLILLDILMPDMNGYEVCEKLKSDPKTCDIPIVFLSALTKAEHKVKAFEVGGADYITKPFQEPEVCARIQHQLKIISLQRELNQKNKELVLQNVELQSEVQERKKVEVSLRTSEERLRTQNQVLNETLQELKSTQAQLIQTEKMSSIGQMVAGIAHEINNPVNFIYGNLNYAEEYVRDLLELVLAYQTEYPQASGKIEELTEQVDLDFIQSDLLDLFMSMKTGSDRIRNIVTALKNFCRLDQAPVKEVDLNNEVKNIVFLLQSRLRSNSTNSEIEVIEDYTLLPKITCYASHLNQAIVNILYNAIEAIEESFQINNRCCILAGSKPKNQIYIHTQAIDNDCVRLQIMDNGCGIPDAVLPQIYTPFFTTKIVGKGTGLGLSVAYAIIVEKHDGKLACESNPGEGTKFTIDLPVKL